MVVKNNTKYILVWDSKERAVLLLSKNPMKVPLSKALLPLAAQQYDRYELK